MKKNKILLFIFVLLLVVSVATAIDFGRPFLQYNDYTSNSLLLRSTDGTTGIDVDSASYTKCNFDYGGSVTGITPVDYELDNGYHYTGVIAQYPSSIRFVSSDCSVVDNYNIDGTTVARTFILPLAEVSGVVYTPDIGIVYLRSDGNYSLLILTIDETSHFEVEDEIILGSDLSGTFAGLSGGCLNSRNAVCEDTYRIFGLLDTGNDKLTVFSKKNNWATYNNTMTALSNADVLFYDDYDADGDNEFMAFSYQDKNVFGSTSNDIFQIGFSAQTFTNSQTFNVMYEYELKDVFSYSANTGIYWTGLGSTMTHITPCQVGGPNSPLEICYTMRGDRYYYTPKNDVWANGIVHMNYGTVTVKYISTTYHSTNGFPQPFTTDVDGDGTIEGCLMTGSTTFECYDLTYTPLVTFTADESLLSSQGGYEVMVTDVDGDSHQDMLLSDGRVFEFGTIYNYTADASRITDWDSTHTDSYVGEITVSDLNADGSMEIIYNDDNFLQIYSMDNTPVALMEIFLPYAVDEDGGYNLETAGTTYNGTNDPVLGKINDTVAYDTCVDSDQLTEYYISANNVVSATVSCSTEGYDTCLLGACYNYNPPIMVSTTINDTVVYGDEDILGTCQATNIFDVSYIYEWKVNDVVVDSGATSLQAPGVPVDIGILTPDNFEHFDNVSLDCYANNSYGSSDIITDWVEILNYEPTIQPTISLQENNLNCYGTFIDGDGDIEDVRSYKWYSNDVDTGYTTQAVAVADFTGGDSVVCEITTGDGYVTVAGNSTPYIIGDTTAPNIFNPVVPTGTIYSDTSVMFSVQCTDENSILSGYPKLSYITPNSVTEEYQMFYDTNNTFIKYLTLSVVGDYTDITFECRDGNNNVNYTYADSITSTARPIIVDGGGGAGGGAGGTGDTEDFRNLTSFEVIPLLDDISITPGSKKLVEIEIKNTDIVDIDFIASILYDENPEAYEWVYFGDNVKTLTFTIESNENIGSNNAFVRYYVDIPEDAQLGTYYGYIEIVGLEQQAIYQIEINVVDNVALSYFGFLNNTFLGAKVWQWLLTLLSILILYLAYRKLRG